MRSKVLSTSVLVPVLLLTAACGTEKTALRQIPPNTTVYIDAWEEDGDRGDQALVEQKPSGLWVVPINAPFRTTRGGDFTVRVTLDPKRGFVVTDLGGTRVGKDHDNCLEEGETYAFMNVPTPALQWEPTNRNNDTSNDDCQVTPEEN